MSPSPISGTPAGVGARLGAFTIDVAVVVVVAGGAGLLASSFVLGAFVAAEVLLALWILQARLGTGPGAALLRLRVSQADAPVSPGAGRAFVRGSLVALGGVVLIVGAWIVEASAAWDRSGRRRSWADKAAETVLVVVPRRARRQKDEDAADEYALATPTVMGRPSAQGPRALAADGVGAGIPLAPVWGASQGVIEALPPGLTTTAATTGTATAAAAPGVSSAAPVPPVAAGDPSASSPPPPGGALLLVFDTGQREQLPLPVTANLGRSPVATDTGDVLITVTDPDKLISKTHLRLEHDGETAWVTDAGSTNGSELVEDDGQPRLLAPGVRTRLDDGVRVRLGERVFTVSRLLGGVS